LNFLLNFRNSDGRQYRWFELSGIAFFVLWYWYFLVFQCIPTWPQRLVYVYLCHACTVILHLQITLSHFAMSTEADEDDELFVVKALRTTMNVDCPEWFDWFHGGLQFQIEHHLFPRIPRCHFRRLVPIVRAFCVEHDLPYESYSFIGGNVKVHRLLYDVAQQLKLLLLTSSDPAKRFKAE
jgi:delta8-fatty-acid desaturase